MTIFSTSTDVEGYVLLNGSERMSSGGNLGIKVFVRVPRELTEADNHAGFRAVGALVEAIDMETARLDPKTDEARLKEKAELAQVFFDSGLQAVFMEPIPNEYFGERDPMNLKSPWYLVPTSIGYIKIGWRKRVLVLDWSRSFVKKTVDDLFAKEDVTKGDRMIHCWSYSKAVEYLKVLAGEFSERPA